MVGPMAAKLPLPGALTAEHQKHRVAVRRRTRCSPRHRMFERVLILMNQYPSMEVLKR